MRRLVYPIALLLFAACMSACVALPPPPDETAVVPGTRIGDFLFARADTRVFTYADMLTCPVARETGAKMCVLRVGTKANIGKGFLDDDLLGGKTLDEKWSGLTYEMTVEGRAVDLRAFGYIDDPQLGLGIMRTPDIVVTASGPGKITIRHTGVYDGAPFDESLVLAFTESGY